MAAASPSRADVERVATRLATGADHDHDHGLEDADPRAVVALARAEPSFHRADSGPTRTKTIQDDWSAEFYKRWRRVKGLIRETIVENDALGLAGGSTSPTEAAALEVNADDLDWWADYVADRRRGAVNASAAEEFDFPTDDEGAAIDAFLDWLRGAVDDEVLEVGRRGSSGEPITRSNWMNVFVRRAYGRGLKFANGRLREAGLDVPGIDPSEAFSRPIHAQTLSRLYTRTFRELDGITEAVGQQISRRLTEGFAKGWNPRKTARELNDRVDAIGLTRSRTLARTETINAHADATLNRYEDEGVDDVAGKAEFDTAGDSDVCSLCRPLEGEVMSIAEARGLIPIHPNCRCAWLPVV